MIEFIPETHTYVVDGIIVPSVSEIIAWHFADVYGESKYASIPAEILERAKQYGNEMHKYCEDWSLNHRRIPKKFSDDRMKESFEDYRRLYKENNIDIVSTEGVISYKGRYAGTYDMLGYFDNKPSLFDIKTTSVLDIEHLEWQLGMYRLALQKDFKCYAVWLPKDKTKIKRKARIQEIKPKSEFEIEMLISEYEVMHGESR